MIKIIELELASCWLVTGLLAAKTNNATQHILGWSTLYTYHISWKRVLYLTYLGGVHCIHSCNKSFTVEYCRFDVSHACNAQKYLLWRFCCNQCRASIISMRDAAHVNSRNEICIDDEDGELKTREEEGKESRNYSNLSADGKLMGSRQ